MFAPFFFFHSSFIVFSRSLNGSLPTNVEIRNNTLFFKGPVTFDLAGTYVCDATNGIGTRTGIVDVNITGRSSFIVAFSDLTKTKREEKVLSRRRLAAFSRRLASIQHPAPRPSRKLLTGRSDRLLVLLHGSNTNINAQAD